MCQEIITVQQPHLFGRPLFGVDQLSAPLVVLVALLHFLTALATGRTKMRRFSLTWSLASGRTTTSAITAPATAPRRSNERARDESSRTGRRFPGS